MDKNWGTFNSHANSERDRSATAKAKMFLPTFTMAVKGRFSILYNVELVLKLNIEILLAGHYTMVNQYSDFNNRKKGLLHCILLNLSTLW
jgi:hypothetical protein